jgi:hypothetical protein
MVRVESILWVQRMRYGSSFWNVKSSYMATGVLFEESCCKKCAMAGEILSEGERSYMYVQSPFYLIGFLVRCCGCCPGAVTF